MYVCIMYVCIMPVFGHVFVSVDAARRMRVFVWGVACVCVCGCRKTDEFISDMIHTYRGRRMS